MHAAAFLFIVTLTIKGNAGSKARGRFLFEKTNEEPAAGQAH
ncbi:hypothetical protein NKH18_09720 [Streptomyces sp. M10(2022)]